jgi:predicted permease
MPISLTTTFADVGGTFRAVARTLRHAPGFTLTVVLTLAIAIGANAAVFSALDAILFQPLPFPNSDRLVYVRQTVRDVVTNSVGPLRLEDWNSRSNTFEALTGYSTEDIADTSGDFAERRRLARVAPRFFDVWGVRPILGRDFVGSEHEPGAASIVVISTRYWQYRFNSDPKVLGSTVRIGNESFQLVGIMDPGFAFPDQNVDFWAPMIYQPDFRRTSAWYTGYGRLKAGVTIEQAQADLARVQRELAQDYPDTDRDIGVVVESLKEVTVGNARGSLWVLYGAVTLLLLIACTNTAALLLARWSHRRHDMAMRRALGASPISLVIRTLSETSVLVVCGSLIGLSMAWVATVGIRRLAVGFPRIDQLSINGGVVAYSCAAVLLVTLLCGLVPALRNVDDLTGRRLVTGSSREVSSRHSVQWLLVGAQVTLSVVLLTGAGLLARSMYELSHVELGFDARNVLTFRISGNFGEPTPVAQTVERVLGELISLPQVNGAAVASPVPGGSNDRSGVEFGTAMYRSSRGSVDPEGEMPASTRIVSPTYFEVMGIPRLEGEPCVRASPGDASQSVGVNQMFASQYYGTRSPVGQPLVSPRGEALRIVAVYGDSREFGADRSPVPTVYDCRTGVAFAPLAFLVRTNGEPAQAIASIRQTVKRVEPARAVYDVSSLESRIGTQFASQRLRAVLMALFAGAALALVCVGVYSTLAYIVNLRHREIGLRIAMGARQSHILRQFVGKAMRVVGFSAALGVVGSLIASRAVSHMLFAVSASDPLTLASVVVVVLFMAVWAALLPSLMASRVDPIVALRQD